MSKLKNDLDLLLRLYDEDIMGQSAGTPLAHGESSASFRLERDGCLHRDGKLVRISHVGYCVVEKLVDVFHDVRENLSESERRCGMTLHGGPLHQDVTDDSFH